MERHFRRSPSWRFTVQANPTRLPSGRQIPPSVATLEPEEVRIFRHLSASVRTGNFRGAATARRRLSALGYMFTFHPVRTLGGD